MEETLAGFRKGQDVQFVTRGEDFTIASLDYDANFEEKQHGKVGFSENRGKVEGFYEDRDHRARIKVSWNDHEGTRMCLGFLPKDIKPYVRPVINMSEYTIY